MPIERRVHKDSDDRQHFVDYDPEAGSAFAIRLGTQLLPSAVPEDRLARLMQEVVRRGTENQAKAVTLGFGSNAGIYCLLEFDNRRTFAATIDHPVKIDVQSVPKTLDIRTSPGAFIPAGEIHYDTRDNGGVIRNITITPTREEHFTEEFAEAQALQVIRHLLNRELVFRANHISLRSPVARRPLGGVGDRLITTYLQQIHVPYIVPKEGESTIGKRLTQEAVDSIFPRVKFSEDQRDFLINLLNTMGIPDELDQDSRQYRNEEDGTVYTPKQPTKLTALNRIARSLLFRDAQWAQAHALNILEFSGERFECIRGNESTVGMILSDPAREKEFQPYGTPIRKEYSAPGLSTVSYEYKVDIFPDSNNRAKVWISVKIDDRFEYRVAFPLQLNLKEMEALVDPNNQEPPLGEVAGLFEYSHNPLHNIIN